VPCDSKNFSQSSVIFQNFKGLGASRATGRTSAPDVACYGGDVLSTTQLAPLADFSFPAEIESQREKMIHIDGLMDEAGEKGSLPHRDLERLGPTTSSPKYA
jgi:hypothetical protein